MQQLFGQHPNADTELNYTTPYELLVATILSAQCTDERVNQVTPALFKRYPNARALARATTAELEPQIQSTGFFRAKSRSLVGHGQRPSSSSMAARSRRTMEALVKLPGVGRKTANVVLGHALGVPGLPVDRHVLRVANRIGIATSEDPGSRRAAAVRRDAARRMDADLRHADPARPPHLQAAPALRPLRRPRRLRLLPLGPWRRVEDKGAETNRAAKPRGQVAARNPESSESRSDPSQPEPRGAGARQTRVV